MGEQTISGSGDDRELRSFTRALLDDVRALEVMLEGGKIESNIRRVGAEQELFLVDDKSFRPMPLANQMLERLDDPRFTHELALFNLEANLAPHVFGGDCLRRMEHELAELVDQAERAARDLSAHVAMVGILPTLEREDLSIANMTPRDRFHRINSTLRRLRGGDFQTYIKGLDELQMTHDNVMLEACNTSFQVHFQVGPDEFARFYNLAQAVTAPVLAAAVNSPLLLRRRLWHETRVALFQQSIDQRSPAHVGRGTRSRVSFGERWVDESVLEIFREDVSRFRVLLSTDLGDPSTEMLARGEMPPLKALCLHNGTVYRWNRPCYGVHEGIAHLRIENRVLPSGPTPQDEVANAALFFGLLAALAEEYGDFTKEMSFDDAKGNFMAAARYGLKARLQWLRGQTWPAEELLLTHLIPLAREGLRQAGIDSDDVSRYLGTVEERIIAGRTGAQWALDSLTGMEGKGRQNELNRAVTAAIVDRQRSGKPVSQWSLARLEESRDWREGYRRVGQVMQTDLFTVHPEDLVDLAASLMDWQHVRHVPVEDDEGRLVGLVSHRRLVRLLARGNKEEQEPVAVREIMRPAPITATPETPLIDAIELMRSKGLGCLPVLDGDRLVGIMTATDFLGVASRLLEDALRSREATH